MYFSIKNIFYFIFKIVMRVRKFGTKILFFVLRMEINGTPPCHFPVLVAAWKHPRTLPRRQTRLIIVFAMIQVIALWSVFVLAVIIAGVALLKASHE
jgi:hypothetical protein